MVIYICKSPFFVHQFRGSKPYFWPKCPFRSPLGTRIAEGKRAEATQPELDIIESTLKSFIGEIEQTPPKFSAIKINGERAYKLARAGKDFDIPSRQVEIYSIDILEYKYPELKIRVHCSSGTYIRTLAEDIGKALNTGAYLTALRRISIGQFNVSDAEPVL